MVNDKLNRQVFNKQDFLNTVDTAFHELGIVPPTEVDPLSTITVEQFFQLYARLFYDIPKEGEINSHRYLINESTDYAGADQISFDIQALLDEIAQLRQDLLNANNTIIELTNENINQAAASAAALAEAQNKTIKTPPRISTKVQVPKLNTTTPTTTTTNPVPPPTPPPPPSNTSSGKFKVQ